MKVSRWMLVALTVGLLAVGAYQTQAFHEGGVAECVGCHSMHAAAGGALLTMNDASSTCLACHDSTSTTSYHVSTAESALAPGVPPGNRTPGGDFAWLKKDYTWNPGWAAQSEDGDTHGHNIIAVDFNYAVDGTNATAPGGTFASADLACTSCHDQHGQLRRLTDGTIATTGAPIIDSGSYHNSPVPGVGEAVGVYRLLRGNGSEDGTGGVDFTGIPVPAAVAPSSYNRDEDVTDTRVAYGAGMGDFCGACHAQIHSSGAPGPVHPVDVALGSEEAAIYNSYVGSGDLTGGVATAYDSLIPFQVDLSTDYAQLATMADPGTPVTTGAAANVDRVTCLSCHRAHASGWLHATRWDNEIELIIVDGEWPGTNAVSPEAAAPKWAKGRTVEERSMAYNNTLASDYATYQRVLCNKCHAKD